MYVHSHKVVGLRGDRVKVADVDVILEDGLQILIIRN